MVGGNGNMSSSGGNQSNYASNGVMGAPHPHMMLGIASGHNMEAAASNSLKAHAF
jgi:hypothetical protein